VPSDPAIVGMARRTLGGNPKHALMTTTGSRERWLAGYRVSICLLALVALLPLLAPPALDARRPRQTALDRYVKTPDPAYRYSLASTVTGTGYTASILSMTSQTWLTPGEVDRTEWTHWLTVIRPTTVKHPIALLFVTGGYNDGKPLPGPNPLLADIAVTTESVVAELRMVPNQLLTFADETLPRREDAVIAYTWDKFLRTGNDKWPLRLPMTKAAVRAMDTVTDFCAKPEQGGQRIERFVVSGASKRGWTTWTTAAVDPRVVAIAPMVIDSLNVEASFFHHWRAYGFWAPAVKDYDDLHIMKWLGGPQFAALMAIEDPYVYRERFTMPKYLINASGDQFFLPDSWQFYFHDLPGEKYLRYVPNTDHSLRNSDADEGLGGYFSQIVTNTPRPQFTWAIDKAGTIRVQTKTAPSSVTLWRATNPAARDFRLESIGPAYQKTALTESEPGKGSYVVTTTRPEKGWTASFVELRFPSGTRYPLVFTTGVTVTPDTLPFDAPTFAGVPPRPPVPAK
jgi:PhoPQ-activated pathogenicity-related protein